MAETNFEGDGDELKSAIAALRSPDVLTQNEGVAAAIKLGIEAVPGLLSLLEDGVNRSQVMYALSQIADNRAEAAFLTGLHDSDARVRSYAALGMVRTNHPQAMAATLQTLNDAADLLHADSTPSVESLGLMGLKAVPPLLDLLMDEDEMTRLRGQSALELILSRRYGFRPGEGFPSPAAAEQMRAAWQENGDYDYSGDMQSRRDAVMKWRQWLEQAEE